MSAVTNVSVMPYSKGTQMHYNGSQYMTNDQSTSVESMYHGPVDYLNNSERAQVDRLDDKQQKDQVQESMQLQRLQADESPTVPQQYQFQGPMPLQLKYAFRPGQKPSFPAVGDPDFDGRRLRRTTMRKTVDYNAAIIRELENRLWQRDFRDREHLQPDVLYVPHILPPPSYPENPFNAVTSRFVKTATNKVRCPVFCLAWTPEGRRLITGTSSGEFTLWNGLTFNFETILQAHDCPVRTMVWSNNELWMLTGDHSGFIKYWQSNMNNVKMYQGHREAVRGVSFSPTDNKFVSCSDDGTVRLWDFVTCNEERIFRGHGADVKCVHWHPYKSLVASGSKDNQQPVKLWDPRSGKSIATIHAHKATVMDIKWNQNGNWVATASRDHLIKLYDIRNLNADMQTFRGHKKETSVVAWHPQHEGLMCSGGSDGSILFWHVGTPKEVASIDQAHDSIVWALAWHPLGHILCSGSNDHSCKFWTRNHPGDPMRDKYNLNTFPASILGFEEYEDEFGAIRIPGMGPEDKVDVSMLPENIMSSIPGLDSGIFRDKNKPQKKVPYAKPIPKNFQAQWNEQRSSKDILNSDESLLPDSKMLLNKLFEHAPEAVNIRDLKVDAMYLHGKVIPVPHGSDLEKVIADGRDRVLDYVNNGNVPELNDVIPHIDPSEYIRRLKALSLLKARGRQILGQLKKPDRAHLKRKSMRELDSPAPSKRWRTENERRYPSAGGWNKGNYRDDYEDDGYRHSSSQQTSHSTRNVDDSSGKRLGSSQPVGDYYPNDSRSRYADSDRSSTGKAPLRGRGRGSSRFPRRPYGNSRSGNSESYSGSRFSNKNERCADNDDEYYDRGGSSSAWELPKGDYYDKRQSDDRSEEYNENDDYYDEYQDNNDYQDEGYRQNSSSHQFSQSTRNIDELSGKRSSSHQAGGDYYPNETRSRYSDSDRGSAGKLAPTRGRSRGSGRFSRRPYGNSRSGNTESYSASRFSNQNERYAENEDEYYDKKWQSDDRNDDYNDQYDSKNDDYYDDYQDDKTNNSNYSSRGSGRYQGSRSRGSDSRGRRNSYGRGGSSSSWRGSRGSKDSPRSRGRGSRRGT